MKLEDFTCVTNDVSLGDYYELYNDVRSSMEHPEWLGLIPREETEKFLKSDGKIWLYYDGDVTVCSVFYLPTKNKSLKKHNVDADCTETGALGPIMVRKEYLGNGLMNQMLKVFNDYNKSLGNKYVFTKAAKDNFYSVNNVLKDGYEIVDEYETERGIDLAFLKEI